jgi:hypothetical protein
MDIGIDEDVDPWVESEGEGEEEHDGWAHQQNPRTVWGRLDSAGWFRSASFHCSLSWSSIALGFCSRLGTCSQSVQLKVIGLELVLGIIMVVGWRSLGNIVIVAIGTLGCAFPSNY